MKILEFITDYTTKGIKNTPIAPDAREKYIKEKLAVKTYLPFAEKRELCKRVLEGCNTKDSNGLVKVDSVKRYLIFTLSVISAYTDLEFSSGDEDMDSLDEYDLLCQNDLLNPILDVIGAEYATCNNILNMMMADIVANNNTIENVLGTAAARLLDNVDDIAVALADKIESFDFDLSQIDINKYKGLIEKFAHK